MSMVVVDLGGNRGAGWICEAAHVRGLQRHRHGGHQRLQLPIQEGWLLLNRSIV